MDVYIFFFFCPSTFNISSSYMATINTGVMYSTPYKNNNIVNEYGCGKIG